MREQTEVQLRITSTTLAPQDIAAKTGLQPDESWSIGVRRGTFGAKAAENGFIVSSGMPVFDSLESCLEALLRKLSPHAQMIGGLSAQCQIEVACSLHRKAAPAVRFERDTLRWFAAMGARLSIDTFVDSGAPRAKAKSIFTDSDGSAEEPKKEEARED